MLEKHNGKIRCLKMGSNDNILISGSADKTTKIWPMEFINNLSKAQEYFENKET